MDLKATYNQIAGDWVDDHHNDTWWLDGTDKYITFLQPGATILDVGCAGGDKAKYLIDKGYQVTGLDFSEEMVKLAQKQIPTGSFFVHDIKQPLTLDEQFDGVFCQAVLLHIPKNQVVDVLKNILEPLKPGGYLYLAVKELRPGHQDEEIVTEADYGYDYSRFFSYFTSDELIKYLEQLGLKIINNMVTVSGNTNWIQIIAQK